MGRSGGAQAQAIPYGPNPWVHLGRGSRHSAAAASRSLWLAGSRIVPTPGHPSQAHADWSGPQMGSGRPCSTGIMGYGFCAGSCQLRGTILLDCRTWASPTCSGRETEPAEEQSRKTQNQTSLARVGERKRGQVPDHACETRGKDGVPII